MAEGPAQGRREGPGRGRRTARCLCPPRCPQGLQLQRSGSGLPDLCRGLPLRGDRGPAGSIDAVIKDMTSPLPMDRLVCGDVGFGKTEVAMRAAFLAVHSGRQVAVLVPTTLLAQQHYNSFKDRFAD